MLLYICPPQTSKKSWNYSIGSTQHWMLQKKNAKRLVKDLQRQRNYTQVYYTLQRHIKCQYVEYLCKVVKVIAWFCLNSVFSYGFVTNTKIKFILVIDSGNIALRENEVRAVSTKKYIRCYFLAFILLSGILSISLQIYICQDFGILFRGKVCLLVQAK